MTSSDYSLENNIVLIQTQTLNFIFKKVGQD